MITGYKIEKNDNVVILTGAGVSAESGLNTFRGKNGYWEKYDVTELATYESFKNNPELVWKFYRTRIRKVLHAEPNIAHKTLSRMEYYYKDTFTLITQNVDDLHRRAGSRNIYKMHGDILKTKCIKCQSIYSVSEIELDRKIPLCNSCRGKLRPDVVWFGETPKSVEKIQKSLMTADYLILIGTSGTVYPAASFVHIAKKNNARIIGINLEKPDNYRYIDEFHQGKAGELLPKLVNTWISK